MHEPGSFREQPSYTGGSDGGRIITFTDGYRLYVDDMPYGLVRAGGYEGRVVQVALCQKANYYHVLDTQLVKTIPKNNPALVLAGLIIGYALMGMICGCVARAFGSCAVVFVLSVMLVAVICKSLGNEAAPDWSYIATFTVGVILGMLAGEAARRSQRPQAAQRSDTT
jgi:hypothetical protein